MEKEALALCLWSQKISFILIRSSLYISDRPQATSQSAKWQEGSPSTSLSKDLEVGLGP